MPTLGSVIVIVPALLRAYCGGVRDFTIDATSVRDALVQLERSHPGLYRIVCDETGVVRRHINVFVNTSHVRDLEGLDSPLVAGDVLTFLPAVSGG